MPDSGNDGGHSVVSTITDDHFEGDDLLEGTFEEDTFGVWLRHFVAGGDEDELENGLERTLVTRRVEERIPDTVNVVDPDEEGTYYSAFEAARELFPQAVTRYDNGEPGMAYYLLGRVAHLVQHMTVPAHVHADPHGGALGGGDDEYEQWVGEEYHFQDYDVNEVASAWDIYLPENLESLFRLTADYTEDYRSDGYRGEEQAKYDASYRARDRHHPEDVSWDRWDRSEDERETVAGDLMPWAMEQTAALFRLFYKEVDASPPVVTLEGFSTDPDDGRSTPFSTNANDPTLIPSSEFIVFGSAEDPQSGVGTGLYEFYTAPGTDADDSDWEGHGLGSSSRTLEPFSEGLYSIKLVAENGAGQRSESSIGYFRVIERELFRDLNRTDRRQLTGTEDWYPFYMPRNVGGEATITLEPTPAQWAWPTGTAETGGYRGWLDWRDEFDGYHLAQDFQGESGAPVYAVSDGTILDSRTDVRGYGPEGTPGGALIARFQTSAGEYFKALYGHIDDPLAAGTSVDRGDIVGYVNDYDPPHLHFGIHPGSDFAVGQNPWQGYTSDSTNTYGWVSPVEFLDTNSPFSLDLTVADVHGDVLPGLTKHRAMDEVTVDLSAVAAGPCLAVVSGPDWAEGAPYELTFNVPRGAARVSAVEVIDRSGSMRGEIGDARNAAKQFVDTMNVGDKIGVVSYSSGALTDFPLAEITEVETVYTDEMESLENWSADAPWGLTTDSHGGT